MALQEKTQAVIERKLFNWIRQFHAVAFSGILEITPIVATVTATLEHHDVDRAIDDGKVVRQLATSEYNRTAEEALQKILLAASCVVFPVAENEQLNWKEFFRALRSVREDLARKPSEKKMHASIIITGQKKVSIYGEEIGRVYVVTQDEIDSYTT